MHCTGIFYLRINDCYVFKFEWYQVFHIQTRQAILGLFLQNFKVIGLFNFVLYLNVQRTIGYFQIHVYRYM